MSRQLDNFFKCLSHLDSCGLYQKDESQIRNLERKLVLIFPFLWTPLYNSPYILVPYTRKDQALSFTWHKKEETFPENRTENNFFDIKIKPNTIGKVDYYKYGVTGTGHTNFVEIPLEDWLKLNDESAVALFLGAAQERAHEQRNSCIY